MFCSKCGTAVQIHKEQHTYQTVSKTFRGNLLTGIGQKTVQEINQFFKEGNFRRVNWSFSIQNGIARSITLVCELVTKPLPYRYGIHMDGAIQMLGILKTAGGWRVEKAIDKFVSEQPESRIRATRPIHHNGVNTMVYILHTYKWKGTTE